MSDEAQRRLACVERKGSTGERDLPSMYPDRTTGSHSRCKISSWAYSRPFRRRSRVHADARDCEKNTKPTSPASISGDTVRSRCPCSPGSSYRRPHPRKPDSTSKSITVHSCARVRASECTSHRCTCTRCATAVAFISNSFNWYSLQAK